MGSDEERLEEMLKAVMETENEKIPVPEIPLEDFPEIPMEDFPEIPMEEIPEIPMEEIPEIPMEEIPEISVDDFSDNLMDEMPDAKMDEMPDAKMDEMPEMPMEEVPEMPIEEAADLPGDTLEEEVAGIPEIPAEKPQESEEEEMTVDPLEFLAMSEEEIDKVLEEEAGLGERFSGKESNGELSDLAEDNSELADIQELLQMSDNHEQVEADSKTENLPFENVIPDEEEAKRIIGAVADTEIQDAGDVNLKPEKSKGKKKEKKKKKEENNGKKKEGFGKKLVAFFFGSDDESEEEDEGGDKGKEGATDAKQNAAVKEKKKKEKKKKEPKKKEADPQKAAKEKLKKEKSAEKAKKKAEKAEAAEKEKRAAKKLPKKKVIVWVLFCASIGAGILLLNTVGMETVQLTEARNAFDDKDFETAYRLLNGRELSEEDQLRFSQSSAVLHLKHVEETYANHLKLGKPVKALNDLLTGVKQYQELIQAGKNELITPELTAEYQNILGILQENYSLSEEGAKEINALESDYEYSLQLEALVNGEVYQSQAEIEQQQQEEAATYPELEDMLPEEEEYFNDSSD
jgi:hypothetical protein